MAVLWAQLWADASSRWQCLTEQGPGEAVHQELKKPTPGPSPAGAPSPPWGKAEQTSCVGPLSPAHDSQRTWRSGPTEQDGPLSITLSSAAQGVAKDQQHHLGTC